MNVLSNASHAIKEKGTIVINTQKEKNEVIIRISDDGIGIYDQGSRRRDRSRTANQ